MPANANPSTSRRIDELVASIAMTDKAAADEAAARQLALTKPPGSLGQVEAIGNRLAAIAGSATPASPEPATVVVFAGDHGVHAEGVSPWPQEVTAQMVQNFCGGGAAINVIAGSNGIDVLVVNAGVAVALDDHPLLRNTPISHGTANLREQAAMSRTEAEEAVLLGADVARSLVGQGVRCLLTGDMGIANTTASAAIISAVTGADPAVITGRGTGIDDATLSLKVQVISDALARAGLKASDALSIVAEIGGLEIAAIAGLCLGGAAARVPVVVDGVITLAGAVIAAGMAPHVVDYLFAGHRSVEPAAGAALSHLDLKPLLELDLRLGEGTGAALAYPLIRAAGRIPNEMATFGEAGVDDGA